LIILKKSAEMTFLSFPRKRESRDRQQIGNTEFPLARE
jgi:hypothetical protein